VLASACPHGSLPCNSNKAAPATGHSSRDVGTAARSRRLTKEAPHRPARGTAECHYNSDRGSLRPHRGSAPAAATAIAWYTHPLCRCKQYTWHDSCSQGGDGRCGPWPTCSPGPSEAFPPHATSSRALSGRGLWPAQPLRLSNAHADLAQGQQRELHQPPKITTNDCICRTTWMSTSEALTQKPADILPDAGPLRQMKQDLA